jgi:VWFA-related protein
MKYFRLLLAVLTCAIVHPQTTDGLRVRVSVKLVQVDAVVTDSHGNHVPGLGQDDFEVLLDGKPQQIRTFNFIVGEPLTSVAATRAAGKAPKLQASYPPAPVATVHPEDVRRTIVVFVDDLNVGPQHVPFIRRALDNFIERQMQPGDLVAIVRASAGLGALQDFSTDKNLLRAAAGQVRWSPNGRGQLSSGVAYNGPLAEVEAQFRAEYFVLGVIDSLHRVIQAMTGLPGRKSIIVLSDGLPMVFAQYYNNLGPNTVNSYESTEPLNVFGRMLRLVDAATRASVVFYAIDTRGLMTSLETHDITSLPDKNAVTTNNQSLSGLQGHVPAAIPDPQMGSTDYQLAWGGGEFLSSQTGGLMMYNTNDIGSAIGKAVGDLNGYYLIGFTPPEEAFEKTAGPEKFHKVSVRVRPAGLHVRSRSGFFGTSDSEEGPAVTAPNQQLAAALDSPFHAEGIGVGVQCSFLKAGRNSSSIRASLVVKAQDLTLEGPAQNRSAVVHLLIQVYSVNGAGLDGGADKLLRVSLNEEGAERALKYGLVYATQVDVKKPGPYRVRVALRDEASGRIGTASELIVVPNLGRHNMALSGLIFPGSFGKDDDIVPAHAPIALAPGGRTRFAFEVFGAAGDAHKLQTQTRLFRDGVKVYEGGVKPIEVGSKSVHGEAIGGDEIQLPGDLAPGDYFLEEEVTSQPNSGKAVRAWQWATLHVDPKVAE